LARPFNTRVQASARVGDGDGGCRGYGERGKALAVQPPGADRADGPGGDAGHRAATGWLIALGQCRGTLAALDSDARDLLGAPADRPASGVQDDSLDIGPGMETAEA